MMLRDQSFLNNLVDAQYVILSLLVYDSLFSQDDKCVIPITSDPGFDLFH